MKKTSLFAALYMIGLLMLPQAGSAKMVALSDNTLSEVIGQAGIANDVIHSTFDSHFDNVSTFYGLLTLSDLTIKGSVDIRNPEAMNITMINHVTDTPPINPGLPGIGMMGGLGSMGIGTHVIDMTTNIDQFSIGAIRPGRDTTGPSLGSIDIRDMRIDVKGTVSITAR